MANFAQPMHNPIDDPTVDELREACLSADLIDEDADLEAWELQELIDEYNAEMRASY